MVKISVPAEMRASFGHAVAKKIQIFKVISILVMMVHCLSIGSVYLENAIIILDKLKFK